jgi:iron complex transport system ATP-binding protein
MGAPVLSARNVGVTIAGTPIITGADVTLDNGQLIAIVGPNGAGKSTLVRSAAGLQRTSSGSIEWHGTDVRRLRGRPLARIRAFVPQRSRVPDGLTARDAVRIGRSAQLGPLRRATRADHAAADEALARAGVEQFAERPLTTLSGGELQRVQIAVALAQDTPALLADEPTSHLDLGATVVVARLLRRLADDGLAVLLVAHDLALAAAIADTIVVMSDGRTVATGPPYEVLDPSLLAEVWHVEADLCVAGAGRTALEVAWLRGPRLVRSSTRP